MDLTEAEHIKKSWQEYTKELYKKDLDEPDNHDGVITHLEPYLLECEVKWPLESITMNKASGGDGIPVELFQILKDDAVKVLLSSFTFILFSVFCSAAVISSTLSCRSFICSASALLLWILVVSYSSLLFHL